MARFKMVGYLHSPVALRQLAEVARLAMYNVYAIYNQKHDKIYIGQSKNLNARLRLHKDHAFKNSYTSRFDGDWILIYVENKPTRQEALKREKQLKSYRGREFIKQHIPRWRSGSAARC